MINPQWLELPMSRTNVHGPKDVRAIEVRLVITCWEKAANYACHLLFYFFLGGGGLVFCCCCCFFFFFLFFFVCLFFLFFVVVFWQLNCVCLSLSLMLRTFCGSCISSYAKHRSEIYDQEENFNCTDNQRKWLFVQKVSTEILLA